MAEVPLNMTRAMRIAVAVAVRGSEVFAGGTFSQAGGVNASLVASWDGTRWSPLGSGLAALGALAMLLAGRRPPAPGCRVIDGRASSRSGPA